MYSKKFKSFLKDYFTLTSRERKGALTLAFLIFVQLSILIWLNYIRTPTEPALEKYKIEIINFVQRQNSIDAGKNSDKNNLYKSNESKHEIVLTEFDPNKINDSTWMQFGLSEKQTAIVRNYLNKGGVFRSKEDVAKIFSITAKQFAILEPYIRIEEAPKQEKYPDKKIQFPKVEIKKININTADTIELCNLPLIGPGRARMIYKYRIALGGFIDEKQLLEVFTMDTVVLNAINPQIKIDKSLVQKFNINSDDFRHPYISKQLNYTIKAFRKEHGNFKSFEDLKQITVINDELISKLAPYVAFE